VESVPANTYARRRILETVSPFGGMPAVGNSNMPAGIMNLVVQADPRDADGGIVEDTGTTGATGNVTIAATDDDNDVNVAYMITTYVLLGLIIVFAIVYGIWYCSYGHTSKLGHLGHGAYGHDDSRTEDLLHHPSHGAYRRSSKY
jgi:hypothetical protein